MVLTITIRPGTTCLVCPSRPEARVRLAIMLSRFKCAVGVSQSKPASKSLITCPNPRRALGAYPMTPSHSNLIPLELYEY